MRYFSVRNRAILREMVVSDFKIRYQGSFLGYLWSLLKPLFTFVILFVVFTHVIPLGATVPHYAVQLFIGVIFWNFLNEATTTGLNSIVASGDIIRKISIPRYLIVVASSVSALINLLLNLVVLFAFILIDRVPFQIEWFMIGILILEVYILAQALSFLLAASNVKYRDIRYIWELILQGGFYATPIIYMASKIPEDFQKYFMLNPMAQIIQDARWMLVDKESVTVWGFGNVLVALIPIGIIVLLTVFASVYFKHQSNTFAEDI
jgi:ABC-2 type transport system permease protein